ncbi:MAG: VOC family protein [Bryobacteraceae bacterium]
MAKVRPIPKGYTTITPGIAIQGADAFIKFCKKAFGAKEIMRMAGPVKGSVMHAEIEIGNSRFMCGDESPSMGNRSAVTLGGTPVTFHIYVENVDKAFPKAIKAGATAIMPPTDMFWGDRYSQVQDPFGNKWALATHIEDMTPAEMKKRGAKWMKAMASPAAAAAAAGGETGNG